MDVRERGLRFTLATISSESVNGALVPIMAEKEGSPFYPEARLRREQGLLCHVQKELRTNIRYKAI